MCWPRGSGVAGNHSRSVQDCSLPHTAAIPLPNFHHQTSAKCCEQGGAELYGNGLPLFWQRGG